MSDLEKLVLKARRVKRLIEINSTPKSLERLQEQYGRVWNMAQLQDEFESITFLAPYVVATRKSDGKRGSLEFQHLPRYYFGWVEDKT